tara:strand:- start:71104 stop:71736 length:633 start_codon:yes stop_codon:yes gene_type:complete
MNEHRHNEGQVVPFQMKTGVSVQPGGMRTDPSLMRAVRDVNNSEAWNTFLNRYSPIVRAFCINRGVPIGDIDDVVQEVFLRITQYSFADRYDPSVGTFRSYLFRVTRSIITGMKSSTVGEVADSQSNENSEAEWERLWKIQAVQLSIAQVERTLSESSKDVLSLTMRGVSPNAIVQITGMSKAAVYKKRERLKVRIQRAFQDFMLDRNEV